MNPETVETVYRSWARFVWLSLQRLGVRTADLDDACQDVFVVVHKRADTFREGSSMRAWLFGIAVRVAANYRRRAHLRREQQTEPSVVEATPAASGAEQPEALALERERRDLAEAILARLSPVKRAVFVMFHIEEKSCETIADELGQPVGTIYSRLHSARKFFADEALKRRRLEERENR